VSSPPGAPFAGLLTDRYELTMLRAALADGTAGRHAVFEVFTRRLPAGRRFGVVAGTARILDAIDRFRFTDRDLTFLRAGGVLDDRTTQYLAGWRFGGDIDGYAEGELYFPGSPVLTVSGSFADCVILETLLLSVLNHDCAVAAGAARMVVAAGNRPVIEMGSRRTHERAAVASARAAYLVGFAATSNLAAGAAYGIPTTGTAAHAFTLLHDSEAEAFRAQIAALGVGTTLLVDTYDITAGIRNAIEVAGTSLGGIRIDSGDLAVHAHAGRRQLDDLGARATQIVLSGDLDEHALAALGAAPVDAYGVGTAVVTGSGAPTAGLVYKLVEVDGRPVAKRAFDKASVGGRKLAVRRHRPTGTATAEVLALGGAPTDEDGDRILQLPLIRAGQPVAAATLDQSRIHHRQVMITLPWDGLKLSPGEPALPTEMQAAGS